MGVVLPNISVSSKRKSLQHYDIFKKQKTLEQLRWGVWLYFFLLVFEGALRKWVLPQLAAPLLIVRDPVAIWMIFIAWKNNEMPNNWYITSMVLITIFAIFTAITLGHGNLGIAIYGARILLFHFPLMFLIGRAFNRDDVERLGKIVLAISLPMVVLITLQFYSPQSAFINRGVGGDIQGGGFAGALGFFRPPATFSFTSGNTQFWSMVGVFVIYFWLYPARVNRLLLLASTIALVLSVPLSISRTLFFQISLTLVFLVVAISRKPKYLGRLIIACLSLFVVMLFLNKVDFFRQAIDALSDRFTSAGENEGGVQGTLVGRFLGGLLDALQSSDQPFFGYGIGMGTNVATKLLTGRVEQFLIAEEEWGRLVGEMGTLLGISVIFIRMHFCLKLLQSSFYKMIKGDFLPWILLSWAFVTVAQSQWAQPTTLGFSTLIGGLTLAALKTKDTTPVREKA